MLIAKNDEEKRSKVWRLVTMSTTIIIILIVVFFITKLFTGNPLKGTWRAEDNNLTPVIGGSDLTVRWDELFEEADVDVKVNYTLDKAAKTITIKADEEYLKKAADESDGKFTEQELKTSLGMLTITFDYSVERNELILTEREYGEQMVFTKE